jgi:two-component system chemotaxis response regulator CheB
MPLPPTPPQPGSYGAIGIVAGSGGVQALPEILAGLPREFPLPILVVHAGPDQILSTLATRLAEKCLRSVTVATDGQVPEPGKVYIAGGENRNLIIEQGRLWLVQRQQGIYDSKDALFRSMARGSSEPGPSP